MHTTVTLTLELLCESVLMVKDRTHISEELFKVLEPILAIDLRYRVTQPGFFDKPYINNNHILWRRADYEAAYEVQMKTMRASAENRAKYYAGDIIKDAIAKGLAGNPMLKFCDPTPFVKMVMTSKQKVLSIPSLNLNLDLTEAWTKYEQELQTARESVRG